ncbi:class I adenylate-forming enzyme family protein [Pseudonocardia sp. N23]|uniref:class I adenylate-forming enzyme family protein n=1 Tax=Pseudonocardia sp. N23 TaxID=1987376 RepID=UPI000BFB1E22|nr:AMP-binding protein [Pseudonocardia sp. N23]GAY07617.1 O-succinylbenzoic acid--CoA ligase [Pseudonocardia sp. N23]
MNISMLSTMAADGMGDRIAAGGLADGLSFSELDLRARRIGRVLASRSVERLGMIDLNSDAVPLALLGAAYAGVPFAPLNYRLADDRLRAVVERLAPATVVVGDDSVAERLGTIAGITLLSRGELLAMAADVAVAPVAEPPSDPDAVAVLLFTSGTSGEPKAAILRHHNLVSYIVSTVEFAGAEPDEAALVGVPPYHVAGVSAVLSNLFAGRRVVRLESFDAGVWADLARREGITHAMVVPTMLARILDELDGAGLPTLRSLSYGGGPMPLPVIQRALDAFPGVGFVNAYGLTETSSTVAVLGPDDHREALASPDPQVRARLGSVGRPLPGLDVSIRGSLGEELRAGERGEIWVRGEQVSGEYVGHRATRADGWFPTRDAGMLDGAGYLYVFGRLDDVIVRGGENLSPGEVEAAMLEHPDVADVAVFGIPDPEWGEAVAAAVVLEPGTEPTVDDLRDHVRALLRSTCAPAVVVFRDALPYTDTGKLLRRTVRDEVVSRIQS